MTLAVSMLALSCVWKDKSGSSSTDEKDSVAVIPSNSHFTADSVYFEDSLFMGDNKAKVAHVKIEGMYPSGESSMLVDSIRVWLAGQLSHAGYNNGDALFSYDCGLLADGKSLAETACLAYFASAKSDFDGFMKDGFLDEGFSCTYEYDYSFKPTFCTDSILTYNFSGYTYFCGAHGSSVGIGQTFAVSTGKRLGTEDMFLTDSKLRLIDLIRNGLWEQYFMAENSGGELSSLEDALLISPDTLPLPACPPLCTDTGMVFIYQQYEIACYAAGMPACVLPYKELKPLMRQEVVRLMPE